VFTALLLTISTAYPAPLFDGQSLEGFRVIGPNVWQVEQTDAGPAIVGVGTALSESSWLFWPGTAGDFALNLDVRIEGAAAGVLYRCSEPDTTGMQGYVFPLDPNARTTGSLQDAGARGILTPMGVRRRFGFQNNRQDMGVVGEADALSVDLADGGWHHCSIMAQGTHLRHFIDGRLVSETFDEDPQRRHLEGGIAFVLQPRAADADPADAERIGRVSIRNIELVPIDRKEGLHVPDGFTATKLLDAGEDEGSWVSMAFEPGGTLLVSPQWGPIRRIDLESGSSAPIDIDIGYAHGMVHAFGALYVIVSRDPPHGGLHRLRDTNGDGRYDEHEHLAVWGNASEHGPHSIRVGPDGRSLWIIQGNHTPLPPRVDIEASPYSGWAEDLLLERQWDANGHAVGILSPGGVVLRTDPDAKHFEIIAGGLRNAYDLAFTPDGSCFTYDSDMEWDMGMPWYRLPRVVHVLPGADSGWRSGTGKWADWYPDAVPAVAHTSPASPTAIVHAGDGAFGVDYEGVLLLADWSYGRIWALTPQAKGASFTGHVELFAEGRPFNISSMRFAPKPDGALYVLTGGRGTASSLWRIAKDEAQWIDPSVDISPDMTQRTHLERDDVSFDEAWRHLGTGDRAMSNAARLALAKHPLESVRARALAERDPARMADGLLVLARRSSVADVDFATELDTALLRLAAATIQTGDARVHGDLLRAMAVTMARRGDPNDAVRQQLAKSLLHLLRSRDLRVRREAARVLVHLKADIVEWLLFQLESDRGEDAMYWALLARLHRGPWTPSQELHYLRWLRRHRDVVGGLSASAFVLAFEARFIRDLDDGQREVLMSLLGDDAAPPAAHVPRPLVEHWSTDVLDAALASAQPEGDGEQLFAAARCAECHRFRGVGGASGPDLTGVGARLSEADLVRAIVEPNRDVSDQYQATWVETDEGLFTGRLIDLDARRVVLDIDPYARVKAVSIPRSAILNMEPSDVSTMPPGLVDGLTAGEIRALVDWLQRP
jgi:putative heme-binding domain-containing protein